MENGMFPWSKNFFENQKWIRSARFILLPIQLKVLNFARHIFQTEWPPNSPALYPMDFTIWCISEINAYLIRVCWPCKSFLQGIEQIIKYFSAPAESYLGRKIHHCPYCNYSTLHKGHMENHIRSHTGEKLYPCTICGKSFAQKSHQRRHEVNCKRKQIYV
nr:zinc finger protein 175 [Parasteatoda tepidariorum]XP_042895780.1 zinc finger protein 175 [Parasteatoda tepidariorum]